MDRVFIMGFWRETSSIEADDWRVRIRNVDTRREYHVNGLDGAFALLRSLLAEHEAGPSGRQS